MTSPAILIPVMVHIAMTLGLLAWLGFARFAAAKGGNVVMRDIALSSDAWPIKIIQINNNYKNQFELPVFFYVLCVLQYMRGDSSLIFIALAWGFVIARFGHTYIHVTSNHVIRRFNAFLGGLGIVCLMWLIFVAQLVRDMV